MVVVSTVKNSRSTIDVKLNNNDITSHLKNRFMFSGVLLFS